MANVPTVLETLLRVLLTLSLVGIPSLLAFRKNNAGAMVAAASITAGVLLTRLPDISSVHMFGLAAELEKQQQQVQVTLDQMQRLAASLAESSFDELAFSGQSFIGLTSETKMKAHDKIVGSLKDIGLTQSQIKEAQEVWISIYCNMLFSLIGKRVQLDLPPSQATSAIPHLKFDSDDDMNPTLDSLKSWITSLHLHDKKIDQLVDAYASVSDTGSMQQPDLIPFGTAVMVKQGQSLPTSPSDLTSGSTWDNAGTLGKVQP